MRAFKVLNLELIRQEVACAVEIEFSAFPFFFPLDNSDYPGISAEGDGFFLLTSLGYCLSRAKWLCLARSNRRIVSRD